MIERTPAILHVCGFPGSGKTTYSRWLEREKGFRHLEFDRILTGRGSAEDGALMAGARTMTDFVQRVRGLRQSAVIEWGFRPYEDFQGVEELRKLGVDSWWFDADVQAARDSFRRRGDVPMEAFEIQVANITSRWPEMRDFFGDKIIPALAADGSYLAHEVIHARMFGGK